MRVVQILHALRGVYGEPKATRAMDPWEMILRESVAYLVEDDVRERVFKAFKKQVGNDAKRILKFDELKMCEVIENGGMKPLMRVGRVKEAARVAVEECDGDVRSVLKRPVKEARRVLKKFPGIGDPGVDKILLFTRTVAAPAVESNGVRVLARLGFASETGAYAKQYRAATGALAVELGEDFDALIGAYQLLRRHGQESCVRSSPRCESCPLAKLGCPVGRRAAGARAWPGKTGAKRSEEQA